jgi:hypothetical protein
MKFNARYLALVLVVGLLGGLLLAACGGGGDNEEATEAQQPAVEATEATEATPDQTEEPPAEVTPPTDAFADLDSYRYSAHIVFGGEDLADQGLSDVTFDMTGAFVAPDRNQVRVQGDVGGLNLEEESIIIGARSWVRSGDTWTEGDPDFDTADLGPPGFFAGFDPEEIRVIEPTEETVNDVDAFHYSIDKADIEQLQALAQIFGESDSLEDLPQDLSLDLWLAKDGGWPVKMILSAQGESDGSQVSVEMSMDITDVNDPSIEVEPPI